MSTPPDPTKSDEAVAEAPVSEHAQDSMQGDEAPAPSSSSADAAPISESESKGDDEPSQPSAAEPAPAEVHVQRPGIHGDKDGNGDDDGWISRGRVTQTVAGPKGGSTRPRPK